MFSDRLPVSYVLIGINVLVSVIAFSQPAVFNAGAFQVWPVMHGEVYRLLTAGFLHVDVGHLLFNMITLFFFGPVLEHRNALGRRDFLIVYFVSLLAGNLTALALHLNDPYYAAVGASGAISGVMIGVSLFAPFMLIMIFGIIPIPAIIYAVLFIGFSAFAMEAMQSNIGHEAHLGGALAGLLLTIWFRPEVLGHVKREIERVAARFRK